MKSFLSYASEDRPTATAIQLVLRTQNHQVFSTARTFRRTFAGHSSLRLLMRPMRRVTPLELSLGVMPNQVAK